VPGIPAVIDLTNLASYGFVIIGSQSGETAGWRVASAGDINGDGFDDMLVDSRSHSSNTGEVHLVFGKASGFGDVDLASLSASDGFTISAAGASDFLGLGIASAGDINNDGYDDFVVTAPSADNVPFEGNGGKAYVVFGKAGGFSSFNVGSLALPDGFFIRGDLVNDQLGWSVSSAGDFNHDGYDDIIVSTQGGSAKAYLIFGKASGFANIDLSALAPADGFLIQGGASSVETGWSVSSGDVNGDDFDDLIIGTSYGDDGGTDAGQAYVIFGKSSGFATIDLATLAPSAGFIIPDGMQEVIGTKEVGLVEYRFRPDSFEVRHVRAPGQTDVGLEELLGKK